MWEDCTAEGSASSPCVCHSAMSCSCLQRQPSYEPFSSNFNTNSLRLAVPKSCSSASSSAIPTVRRTSISSCSDRTMRNKDLHTAAPSSYREQGESFLSLSGFDSDSDNEAVPEQEVELPFYNDDGSHKNVVVESHLCAGDLCQLLALKNHATKDNHWSIVELWPEFGIERTLEDQERILEVYQSSKQSTTAEVRFVFRRDFRKYEFFHNPQQFFPFDMVDISSEGLLTESPALAKALALQEMLAMPDAVPQVYGYMWICESNKQVWKKVFFLLRQTTLYFSSKVHNVAKYHRFKKDSKEKVRGTEDPLVSELGHLQCYADLTQCQVYSAVNAKNQYKAPTEFGICLKVEETGTQLGTSSNSKRGFPHIRCIACESERTRLCWLTAIRLAKYGRKIRDSYKQCRARLQEPATTTKMKEYGSYQVSHESVRSRVAMDFTGRFGRIVEDPQEASAIAEAEGYVWKRRKPFSKTNANQQHQSQPCRSLPTDHKPRPMSVSASAVLPGVGGLSAGIHITQPWFHSGMSREEATLLLTKHGMVDGVFVVRESRSKGGVFVLSYLHRSKVYHTQINTVTDQVHGTPCFTLDAAKTKFYDLLQLVEFYQLNAGSLPTRLTYYVMQACVPVREWSIAASF